MYVGNNATAIRSQRWIVDSLLSLMEQKPYAEITVRDICKKADLSRQTFYNVFDSKDEVLCFRLRNEYQRQFARFCNNESITVPEIVEAFTAVLLEDKRVLSLMIDNGLEDIISSEISKCVSMFASRFVKAENDNELLPYSIALVSGALAEMLVYWFKRDEPISIDKLTSLLTDFLSGNLYKL